MEQNSNSFGSVDNRAGIVAANDAADIIGLLPASAVESYAGVGDP